MTNQNKLHLATSEAARAWPPGGSEINLVDVLFLAESLVRSPTELPEKKIGVEVVESVEAFVDGRLIWSYSSTFSTRLTDADVPESVNAALMAHSSKRTSNRRYARATWEKKVDAIRRLPWLLCDSPTD